MTRAIVMAMILFVCRANRALGEEQAAPANERICGPRCAAFIERRLGKSLSVNEAVRRLQWPDVSAGCSMADLRDLFHEDGLKTTAVTIEYGELPEITGPAIVAVQKLDVLDHFVVVLQATPTSSVSYWDGLEGMRHEDSSKFWSRARRQVLLVGTRPPVLSRVAARRTDVLVNWMLVIGGGLVIVGLVYHVSLTSLLKRRVSNGY